MSATRERVRDTNISVLVCSAKDIVRSKREAARGKDRDQLPGMRADMGVEADGPENGPERD